MAVTEVKRLADTLKLEYNKPNPDLAKCGQYLSQLKVRQPRRHAQPDESKIQPEWKSARSALE